MIARESSTKAYEEKLSKLRHEIEKRSGKSADELYEEREKRIRDAIELREPDRVPVVMGGGNFAARYVGVPLSAAYYDIAAYKDANIKTMVDFDADLFRGVAGASAGVALEALGSKQMRWPGGNLAPDIPYQFVEGEYMNEDEYPLFLSDPTDYTLRYHLPRVFGVFEPLSKLPALRNLSGTGFTSVTPLLFSPEFRKIAEALYRAGQAQEEWRQAMSTSEEEMAFLGYPPVSHMGAGVGQAPFDVLSDFYRGMRGTMTDMYRHPQELLAACDKILEWRISTSTPADPNRRGNPKRMFMPLHRGAEGFMSKKQFETFYWPGLKKAILSNIEMGYVPMPFFEGRCDSRLEYLLELPKGSIVCHFEHTDMARAKEILGDHLCIMGNVPSPLLQVASPSEVEEYCKNLIKVCGKGGGFILTNGSSIDEARPANVKAMVDSVKKYGVN